MTDNKNQKRPFGLAKGQFSVPDSFFEPLPDALLSDFAIDPEPKDSLQGSGNYTEERKKNEFKKGEKS